jgi:serine/threonine-protein kinase
MARRKTTEDAFDALAPRDVDAFVPGALLEGVYELRQVIGRGGMGQVFDAWDHRLRRAVAIKAPWPETRSESVIREAQALASIRHRGVLAVFALGEHAGAPYVVMERLHGTSLHRHMLSRRESGRGFDVEEVVRLLIALADALRAVHAAGIAHRDVKPENVMLAPDGRVVLLDFGLMLAQVAIDGSLGYASGTPEYMSPESATDEIGRGEAHLVDVYALGVLAFELLTGTVPYVAQDAWDVLRKQVLSPVPDVTRARLDLPDALSSLITSMLAKRPIERPGSMDEVLTELRRIDQDLEHAPSSRSAPLAVLVVDDDREVANLLATLTQKRFPDAQVRMVHDGLQAAEEIARRLPDVLLLDLHMPKMNGMEVCMYVRGVDVASRCTIVPVSAVAAQPEDLDVLSALGVRHFVTKGTSLGARVMAILDEVRARVSQRR